MQCGEPEAAEEFYRSAINIEPDNTRFSLHLGILYLEQNDFEKSELSKDAQKNHLIHFKNPGRRRFSYYALAGWNRDEAVQSPDQWKKLVAAVQEEIANPPQVNVGAVEY